MMNNMVKKDLTQDIGSRMSGNFVCIRDTLTIREAMSELVRQAGVHDNIATLYVVDAGGVYAGAIDLKDLIIARENDRLADIIRRGYPYVFTNERTADCAERIADYEEDSLPVLTEDRHIAGVLTAQELVELVDDAMGDDYAKLGGLTSEEDLREPVLVSMKKRVGLLNGGCLGVMALAFLGVYVRVCKGYAWLSAFLISGCVGVSLVVAMVISSLVGTLIPMLFHRIRIDPAVASGPLITTVNDLVAVVTYYGLALVFLVNMFHI